MQDEGRFSDNILYFARSLRDAGMRVGPANAVDAVRAVKAAGICDRDDFYWTLHCVLVSRHEDHVIFDEAFRLFWRSRDLVDKMIELFSPVANPTAEPEKPKAAQSRVAEALFQGNDKAQEQERPEIEVDAEFTVSGKEVLKAKDFAQMTAAEIHEAQRAIARLILPVDLFKTRRYQRANHGRILDPRAMLRQSLRTGGDLLLPAFRKRREIHPPVVVLADISGSMSQYTRIFLHFLHALTENRRRVHTFLFGTRLTNITRSLRMKDPDEALIEVSSSVEDWEGGTRIGDTLHQFNRAWSRRVLGQGAIVLLITDGLERDSDEADNGKLSKEMERLHKSCRRLIWLNPLLRYAGFEARASGIRTMLPHVDEFRPVHSLEALEGLCQALSTRAGRMNDPKTWLKLANDVAQRGA
jgi:uncharacterized protein with von Willebrand factor type A (vWA) domain